MFLFDFDLEITVIVAATGKIPNWEATQYFQVLAAQGAAPGKVCLAQIQL